eukprot:4163694-Prorocentrum_lima.AAC.1
MMALWMASTALALLGRCGVRRPARVPSTRLAPSHWCHEDHDQDPPDMVRGGGGGKLGSASLEP